MAKLLTVELLAAVVLDPACAHPADAEIASPTSLRTADDGRLLLQVASAGGSLSSPQYKMMCWFLFHKAWCGGTINAGWHPCVPEPYASDGKRMPFDGDKLAVVDAAHSRIQLLHFKLTSALHPTTTMFKLLTTTLVLAALVTDPTQAHPATENASLRTVDEGRRLQHEASAASTNGSLSNSLHEKWCLSWFIRSC